MLKKKMRLFKKKNKINPKKLLIIYKTLYRAKFQKIMR